MDTPTLTFTVLGEPVAKGSVVARVARYGNGSIVYKNGQPVVIKHDSSGTKGKKAERGIAQEALVARTEAHLAIWRGDPLAVTIRFFTGRNKGHYGSGRNSGLLKDSAPARPAKKPDVDKWARHALDALTGVIYTDDGQVVRLVAEKWYAEGSDPPRTEIEVAPIAHPTIAAVAGIPQMQLVG